MKEYSMSFIKEYSIITYEKYLKSKQFLSKLTNNYLDRYKSDKDIDGEEILIKESIDHYMLKLYIDKELDLKENKKIKEKYLNYLYELIIQTNGLETITNPFIIYLIENNIINNFYDKDKTRKILKLYQENLKKVNIIIEKINTKKELTQQELNYISIYFGTKRNLQDKNYSKLITYIFTKLHESNNLICSEEILTAIINYLPKELPTQKYIEPEDIRIILMNFDTDKIAQYNPGKNHVHLNMKYFKNVDFNSIESLKKTYVIKQKRIDFIHLLIIVYHELFHQIQCIKSKKDEYTYEGAIYANKSILNTDLYDYHENHDNDLMEIEATRNGWNICRLFLKKYLLTKDSKKIQKRCAMNELGTKARRAIAKKTIMYPYLIYTHQYDINNLSRIIGDDQNNLKFYPVMKEIYNEEGKIKLDLVTKNHHDPFIISYIEYMLNNKMLLTDKAYEQIFKNKNSKEINNILNNIYNVIRQNISYINLINNLIKYQLYGEYNTNTSSESLKETKNKYIIDLYNNYLEFLNIISFIKEKCNVTIDSFWYQELSQPVIDTIKSNNDDNLSFDISKIKSHTNR